MLKQAALLSLVILTAISISRTANAKPIAEGEVSIAVATILNASQEGKTVHVDGDFGVDARGVTSIPILFDRGQWSIEVAPNIRTTDLENILIDGVKLTDVIKAATIEVGVRQTALVWQVQQMIKASAEGRAISVRAKSNHPFTNVAAHDVVYREVFGSTISSNKGKFSFELGNVTYDSLLEIAIEGITTGRNRRSAVQTCEGIFRSSI